MRSRDICGACSNDSDSITDNNRYARIIAHVRPCTRTIAGRRCQREGCCAVILCRNGKYSKRRRTDRIHCQCSTRASCSVISERRLGRGNCRTSYTDHRDFIARNGRYRQIRTRITPCTGTRTGWRSDSERRRVGIHRGQSQWADSRGCWKNRERRRRLTGCVVICRGLVRSDGN